MIVNIFPSNEPSYTVNFRSFQQTTIPTIFPQKHVKGNAARIRCWDLNSRTLNCESSPLTTTFFLKSPTPTLMAFNGVTNANGPSPLNHYLLT